jgi:hypothetical protein
VRRFGEGGAEEEAQDLEGVDAEGCQAQRFVVAVRANEAAHGSAPEVRDRLEAAGADGAGLQIGPIAQLVEEARFEAANGEIDFRLTIEEAEGLVEKAAWVTISRSRPSAMR